VSEAVKDKSAAGFNENGDSGNGQQCLKSDPRSLLHRKELISAGMKRAFVLSLLLHVPILMHNRISELIEERNNITYAVREWITSIFNAQYFKGLDYKNELQAKLENGEEVDFGEFYLNTEYIEGRIEYPTMKNAQAKLGELVQELKKMAKDKTKWEVLQRIIDMQGNYSLKNSYLSSILLDGKGNCHARQKLMATLVHSVYPDMEITFQTLKIDGGLHTRALIKIDGKIYAMEKPILSLVDDEAMSGTILYESDDEVDSYTGREVNGAYLEPKGQKISSYTKFSITDDYLSVPMPVGIGEIRNFKSFSDSNTGKIAGSGAKGGGAGGKNGIQIDSTGIGLYSSGSGRWMEPTELRVVTDEEAKKMLETSRKREAYLKIDTPAPAVLPSLKDDPENAISTWEELLSGFMYSMLKNEKTRMPSDAETLEHPLFQNYFLLSDRVWGSFFKTPVELLSRSPKLQETLYEWSIPYLKKAFVALDKENRQKHLNTLLHLREYLKTYDHKREEIYLAETTVNDGYLAYNAPAFVSVYPGNYHDGWNAKDITISDESTYRYAEAFIFRRIRQGMSLEDAKKWVERGIQDMQSLIDEPKVKF